MTASLKPVPRHALSILRREGRAVVAALLYFSRLPVPGAPAMDDDDWRRSMSWWPLVGVVVGALIAATWWVAEVGLGLPPGVAVGCALGVGALATGALQEDGFADVCDGFGGGKSKEHVLEIMRDSRIGAYGVVGLVMLIGLKWQTMAALPPALLPPALIAVHAASRAWAAALMVFLPYARTDASRGSYVSSRLRGGRLAVAATTGAVPVAVLLPLPLAAATLATGAVVWAGCSLWYRHRLGGFTGDGLGAGQQIGETAALLVLLAAAPA